KLVPAYNNLGQLYYLQGELDSAISVLKQACALAPRLATPRALLGFALFGKGDFERARKELKTASELNPKDVNVRLFLGRSLIQLQDLNGALAVLQELQKDNPNDPEMLYSLGSVYSGLAETTVGQIQKVAPDSYLIEVLLGQYSEIKQVYADAAEHYKRAVQKAPADEN